MVRLCGQYKNPVLCRTEALKGQEGHILKYALCHPAQEAFGEAVSVLPSEGTRAHPESMNKIAFKADGVVVVLFEVKHPLEGNPFAGSVYFTLSGDDGSSWTEARYLHSDTLPDYGRGYFDMATLADGEVGAVWLDGRFAAAALFFARTEKGKGFGPDQQTGESTCECCRTDILTDAAGRIHVAYRDITHPAAAMGKQLRDLSYSYSDDNGKTFTKGKPLSADGWAIEGCPHTGPSLAADENGLHALWFTEGGGAGVYYARSAGHGKPFTQRELISKEARYPQLLSLPAGGLAMAWTQHTTSVKTQHAAAGHGGTHQQHGGGHQSAAGSSEIIFLWKKEGQTGEEVISGREAGSATHPVLAAAGKDKVLIAWAQEQGEKSGIFYRVMVAEK